MHRALLLGLWIYSFSASAYFQLDFMKNKTSNKISSQWNLADWLAQKNRMALADQWLALNSSANLVEIVPSGGYQDYKIKANNVNGHAQSYQLDIYISIFNLMGEFEKTTEDQEAYGGAAGFRLLGNSAQTTNLVARYGWRKLHDLTDQEEWENQYLDGQLQIYLLSMFGVQGKYRHYFPADSNKGNKLEGHRATAGAFIDLGAFRLFGDYYQEPIEKTSGGVLSKEERKGFEYGLKLFF